LLGLVAYSLSQAGYLVVKASDGHTAIAIFDAESPDLVILDINMPGGNGLDALRKLKNSSKTNNVPVIIITGSTDQKLADEVLTLGATHFLPKPIEPAVLLEAVRTAVL
jgi:DNA-binding response OmpR family regulator